MIPFTIFSVLIGRQDKLLRQREILIWLTWFKFARVRIEKIDAEMKTIRRLMYGHDPR